MQAPIWSEDSRKGTFFRQIYEERLSDYLKCPPQKTGFFDRGLPDSIAYTRFMRLKVPDHLIVSVKSRPYNPKVFFTPVWPEIFSNDAIRREDLKTASELHQLLQEVYEELGYTIIELPKADVATRIGIILDTVKRSIEQQSDR
jgi:predicted ATPase